MKYICYAAYNNDFFPLVRKIFKILGKKIDLQVYNSNNPQKLLEKGAKVILARGGTAIRIRQTLEIPVVEIPIPFEDMIQAFLQASKIGNNVGVIGYGNLLKGFELLNPILNINMKQAFANNEEEMRSKIIEFKNQGIDVIIGGIAQTNIAKELNMNYVRIDFSIKALSHAYKEAELILKSMFSNIRKNEELKAILDNTKEGYVSIDKYGCITLMNQTALKLIPGYKNPIGEDLRTVFPELKNLLNTIKYGKEYLQEIAHLKGIDVLYNMIPLRSDNREIIGAIATFNNINTIRKGEHKIRDKILNKGFYATYKFSNIKGKSKLIKDCIDNAVKFAPTNSTVLIVGETGVGKELFAQSIHNASLRKKEPFVAINCASLPESILESELFGYEEGAFTGASKDGKAGLFELAHKGTIFLDEIAEMPLRLQARFLRVLQEKKVMRLGSDQIIPIDVRIIAATNKKIQDLVLKNKFREDLFYRLNVLTLTIPPIRQRKEDIYELIQEFWLKYFESKQVYLTKNAIIALEEYKWPGNIRQLKNFIERLSIINTSEIINKVVIKNMIKNFEPVFKIKNINLNNSSSPVIEKGEIEEALELCKGNRTETSNLLGIHRSTLWRLMKKYGIN